MCCLLSRASGVRGGEGREERGRGGRVPGPEIRSATLKLGQARAAWREEEVPDPSDPTKRNEFRTVPEGLSAWRQGDVRGALLLPSPEIYSLIVRKKSK